MGQTQPDVLQLYAETWDEPLTASYAGAQVGALFHYRDGNPVTASTPVAHPRQFFRGVIHLTAVSATLIATEVVFFFCCGPAGSF